MIATVAEWSTVIAVQEQREGKKTKDRTENGLQFMRGHRLEHQNIISAGFQS